MAASPPPRQRAPGRGASGHSGGELEGLSALDNIAAGVDEGSGMGCKPEASMPLLQVLSDTSTAERQRHITR